MPIQASPPLPSDLAATLKKLGEELATFHVPPDLLERTLRRIGSLPAAKIASLDGEIAKHGNLFVFYNELMANHSLPGPLTRLLDQLGLLPRPKERISKIEKEQMFRQLLQIEPGLEFLFLFHRNGYLRQAALDKLDQALPTSFYFAAVAYRLNDWVPQVSVAAAACLARVLPKTDREIVASVAIALIDRAFHWRRWGKEAAILEEAFARDDVVPVFAQKLRDATTGAMGRCLGLALRWPSLDQEIPRLAREAVLPSVRARALRVLLEEKATWQAGFEQKMVDPYHRTLRWVPILQSRPVVRDEPIETWLLHGACDRSAAVRKIAATALVQNRHTLANRDEIIALLEDDRSPSVRSAVEFVIRDLKERAVSP